jgi:hypothetical protein
LQATDYHPFRGLAGIHFKSFRFRNGLGGQEAVVAKKEFFENAENV